MILSILSKRWFLYILLAVNTIGTVYGYVWYGGQLKETPIQFLLFVPDSPTASLFFMIVIIAFLLRRNWPVFEALAMVTLIKYGIWAVVMNLLVVVVTNQISGVALMLIASHGAMALQGLLYAPLYRIKPRNLIIAAVWTLHNDVIDYLFAMMPQYSVLDQYIPSIGYFTFWLSMISILTVYCLNIWKSNSNELK